MKTERLAIQTSLRKNQGELEKRCNRSNGYCGSRGSDEEESNSRHFNLWAGFAHGDELHAGALQLDIKIILTNVAQQTR